MNNKEYELIVENWRAFLNESKLDEGMIDSIKTFITSKITSTMKKFSDYVNQNSIKLDQSELAEISAQSNEFKEINDGIIKTTAEIKNGVDDINRQKNSAAANTSPTNAAHTGQTSVANEAFKRDIKKLEEQYEKIENLLKENKKQYNEFIEIAAAGTGIALGALGLGILILKGLIKVAQAIKFVKTAEVFKKALQLLEFVEQKIKNFISRLEIFDILSYNILKIFLKKAKENPGGDLRKKFAKAGVSLLLTSNYRIPPLKAMLNPDNFTSWEELGSHIEHSYPGDGAHHGGVHEKKSRASREKQAARAAKKDSKIAERLKEETKILVSINQKIVWFTILGCFAVYGGLTLLSHGIHGLLGIAELGATGVKVAEVVPKAVTALA